LLGLAALRLLPPAVRVLTAYQASQSPVGARPSGTALTERVVVVVLSGVSSQDLAGAGDPWRFVQLRRLAAEGAYGGVRAVLPSADAPAWAALISGAGPERSGIVDAHEWQPFPLPSLFDDLPAGSRSVAVASRVSWQARGRMSMPDETVLARSSMAVVDETVAVLHRRSARLVFVLLDHGRVSGLDPTRRWSTLDDQVAAIATALDPAVDTLVITSDHGLLPDGSSGGSERHLTELPLVLWGRGIAPGALPWLDQREIAPTVAALLGLPYSPYGGRPVFDALRLSPAERSRESVRLLETRLGTASGARATVRDAAQLLVRAQGAADHQEWAASIAAADEGLNLLEREPGLHAYWTSGWLWGFMVPLALIGAGWLLHRFHRPLYALRVPFMGVLAYYAAWIACFYLLAGKPLSLSALYGDWTANLAALVLLSALAFAVVAVGLGFSQARAGVPAAARTTGRCALLVLASLASCLLVSLLAAGWPSARLPNLAGWTAVLFSLGQAAAVGLCMPVALLLTAMIAEVAGRGR
jgi:hypothetical protein